MTREETVARMTELERKLAARTGKSGFAGNCEAIKTEIAKLGIDLEQLDVTTAAPVEVSDTSADVLEPTRDIRAAALSLAKADDAWLAKIMLHDPDMIRAVAAALLAAA